MYCSCIIAFVFFIVMESSKFVNNLKLLTTTVQRKFIASSLMKREVLLNIVDQLKFVLVDNDQYRMIISWIFVKNFVMRLKRFFFELLILLYQAILPWGYKYILSIYCKLIEWFIKKIIFLLINQIIFFMIK